MESFYSRDNCHSWQTPTGNFYKIRDTHSVDAGKNIVPVNSNDPVMDAWKRGYNRIHYYGNTLYVNNEIRSPSTIQIRHLIQLAKENNFEEVEYDGGETSYIIWSINDTLE